MTDVELSELLSDCPVLYHMAERGSWPSIEKYGLLSTSALLDAFGVSGSQRERIEDQRRPENVPIFHADYGEAVIRDQKPMDDAGLHRCLRDGITPKEWYRILNSRVFFWLTRDRLHRLLEADAYRNKEHDVLEIDATPLVEAHRNGITLAPMNTGCTRPFAHPRGVRTFKSIEEYPYAEWRSRRKRGERVVELAVKYGVPDIRVFVRRVVVMKGPELGGVVWQRSPRS